MSRALLDRSRVEIKMGPYGTAPAMALGDPAILLRVQEYRRRVGARMTAISRDEIKRKIPAAEYHVSRKVDGEFTVLVLKDREALTVNPGGTVRVGLPFLDEASKRLSKAGIKEAWIVGELYVHRTDRRPRVHDVSRLARQPESEKDLDALRFAVFDLIHIDGKQLPFPEAWKRITEIFAGGKGIHPVESVWTREVADVETQFEHWVDKEGAEGLVVRSETAGMFKVKPRLTIDAAVVGFTEGTDEREGLLHDMLVALMRPEGLFHVFARVGGGFSDDQRRSFLSDLKDMAVASDYVEVNPDHVAYQMVKPEWVIELSCVDLISQTTRGGSIDRMVLSWNGKYEPVRRLPLASTIFPVFERVREDKTIQPSDLRIQQVSERVEVQASDQDARELTLPKSEPLRRQVYTKTMKGEVMVRKLVMWKTNKEAGGEFPAYVIHFTDFSPNRKTTLERDMRVSSSREQIDRLWDGLVEKNIKKGWSPVGDAAVAEKPVKEKAAPKSAKKKKPAKKKPGAKKKK